MDRPVVFLGGFLSYSALYAEFRRTLSSVSDRPVWVVPVRSHDWLLNTSPLGWAHLLGKVDKTVREALRETGSDRATLVGHSAGGLLSRLYLSPRALPWRGYEGLGLIDEVISLGTPHYARRRIVAGGLLSNWVEDKCPGSCYSPAIRYTSVAGRALRGDASGTKAERAAFRAYRIVGDDGEVWGDGIVPVRSASLDGSRTVVLEGVAHYAGFGLPWYGSDEVVERWWPV